MEKKYEIIVYGATGFTGQICCKYLRDNYNDLVWAIAGRNGDKLDQIKSDFSLNCDVVVADGGDIDSLRALTSKTKVVLSTACLLYTSPSPRDATLSRMPSSA